MFSKVGLPGGVESFGELSAADCIVRQESNNHPFVSSDEYSVSFKLGASAGPSSLPLLNMPIDMCVSAQLVSPDSNLTCF